jgi:hypothetical protein
MTPNRQPRTHTVARLALFAGLLGLVFAGAALAGSALDPDVDREAATSDAPGSAGGHSGEGARGSEGAHSGGGRDGSHSAGEATPAKGLAQADRGLRLVIDDPAAAGRLAFRIVDERGATVRDFDVEHARRMHLIVVRRDLSGFQHLHPKQTKDGGWTVPLRLDGAGTHRVFADFSSGGESYTLGTDLQREGRFVARELPHPAQTVQTDTGLDVRLDRTPDGVRFTVFDDGRRVKDIEPYLGARGHLVALRQGDLAFLHVHPESEASEGSDIRFAVDYPSKGRYRLFLQFKVDGRVHTAAFTREVGEAHGH